MWKQLTAAAAVGLALLDRVDVAEAQDGPSPYLPELRVGLLLHDVGAGHDKSDTLSLNLEFLFSSLHYWDFESPFVDYLLNPVPMVGGNINTDGGVNTGYLALAWPYEFEFGLFVIPGFGMGFHDGRLERDVVQCPPTTFCSLPGNRALVNTNEPILGSRVLFRESLEIGYRFADIHSVSIFGSHLSNAGLADDNDGLDFVGIRYGLDLGGL